jgi:protein-L-isoaspartate O-methyltransferase
MTSTDTTTSDWRQHAAGLVAALTEAGDLHDPAWAAAVAATPRHLLVPTAYQQQPDGTWAQVDTSELAYTATTLVTELDRAGLPVSSSTKPDLMLRMLEILDVHDGQQVLEIGTGPGYNAALLSHRLGSQNVFSIDVDAELVDLARRRLAAIGCHPHLDARDGIDGWPDHAPYDRLIATCSVPRIPWSWADQLTPGGLALADLKLNIGAGNLVLLRREDDRLEGRFTARWAAFMQMRRLDGHQTTVRAPRGEATDTRVTAAPAQPWNTCREAWLLASLHLPPGLRTGYILDPATRAPKATTVSLPDGSWCEIELAADDSGLRRIREGGPIPLWEQVERTYDTWTKWGQPTWRRFGLTVTADTQMVWLDDAANVVS